MGLLGIIQTLTFLLVLTINRTPWKTKQLTVFLGTASSYVSCEQNFVKNEKTLDVDDRVKQRVVIHFLTKEKVPKDEIARRLRPMYGEDVVDVEEVAGPDDRQSWTLDPRVSQRVVIQFLSTEGVGPKEIVERLRRVYSPSIPASTVQRWSQQFRQGRTSVSNRRRTVR